MFGEAIGIIREGTPTGQSDARGNPIRKPSTRFTSDGWAIAPVAGSGIGTSQETHECVGYTLYKPERCETIFPTDRVWVRGRMHAVEGTMNDWDSPFACGVGGLVVHVKRVN